MIARRYTRRRSDGPEHAGDDGEHEAPGTGKRRVLPFLIAGGFATGQQNARRLLWLALRIGVGRALCLQKVIIGLVAA